MWLAYLEDPDPQDPPGCLEITASPATQEQEAFQVLKGHQDLWERKGRKVKWETKAPEGPQHGGRKVNTDRLDYLVSQEDPATVKTVGMARGDLLVFPDSPEYQGLLEQPVLMVTATRQLATYRQGPPNSLWT